MNATNLIGANCGVQDQNGTTFGATSFGIQVYTFGAHTTVDFYCSNTANGWGFTGTTTWGDTGSNEIFQIHNDPGGNPVNNSVQVWCPTILCESAATSISAIGGTLAIVDASGNGMNLNGSGLVTFAKIPAITSGYFAGAAVARAAGSGDTTGTVAIGSLTPQTAVITYVPGTSVASNIASIVLTLGTALPFTPNPIFKILVNGAIGALDAVASSVTTGGFKIAMNNICTAGQTYTFTVLIA